jgi:hypothetical protein
MEPGDGGARRDDQNQHLYIALKQLVCSFLEDPMFMDGPFRPQNNHAALFDSFVLCLPQNAVSGCTLDAVDDNRLHVFSRLLWDHAVVGRNPATQSFRDEVLEHTKRFLQSGDLSDLYQKALQSQRERLRTPDFQYPNIVVDVIYC